MSTRVQSVERSIGILIALSDGAKTLTDVTRATGLSKGTAFRLLASLNYEQLVIKDTAANAYMLGPGFLRLFQGVMGDLGSIASIARPILTALWQESNETVALHVRIGAERICVAELPSPQPIRYVSAVGTSAPLHVGSAGKSLLAFLTPATLERTLPALPLGQATEATITDIGLLREELATINRQGWAMSTGERIVGASAISVPIRSTGDPVAALSVLGPSDRLSPHARLALLPALRVAADGIQKLLGSAELEGRQSSERGES